MAEYLIALGLAMMTAMGNVLGGIVAQLPGIPRSVYGLSLHAAVGIVLAVIGVELMPRALQVDPPWIVVLALILGGVFYFAVHRVIDLFQKQGNGEKGQGAWNIYAGVAVDLFSDGIMIGVGSSISFGLGLFLALGQVAADIPEGFATAVAFKNRGVSRIRSLIISGSFALPVLVGTSIGYWLVQGKTETLQYALLAFTSAILLLTSVEEMLTEAHAGSRRTLLQEMTILLGFAGFTLLSLYLG